MGDRINYRRFHSTSPLNFSIALAAALASWLAAPESNARMYFLSISFVALAEFEFLSG